MARWSDGAFRSENYRGTELERAIMKYFEDRQEEELLALKWDNEYLRPEAEKRRAFERTHPKVMAAGA